MNHFPSLRCLFGLQTWIVVFYEGFKSQYLTVVNSLIFFHQGYDINFSVLMALKQRLSCKKVKSHVFLNILKCHEMPGNHNLLPLLIFIH